VNPLFARFINSVYRREPVSGFILILGATDALVGGLGGRESLLSIGLLIALLGLIMRWRQGEKKDRAIANEPARYLLPPGRSRTSSTANQPFNQPLPLLINNKQKG
jgi:hypothetical protein